MRGRSRCHKALEVGGPFNAITYILSCINVRQIVHSIQDKIILQDLGREGFDLSMARPCSQSERQHSDRALREPFIHDAVHDMESLKWALIHICLTRRAPGIDMLRDELRADQEQRDAALDTLVFELFDDEEDRLWETKASYIYSPVGLEGALGKFRPSLTNTVARLSSTIRLAHEYH